VEITSEMVKNLRQRTGAGIMDCRHALQETEGDVEKAIDSLRSKGLAAAAKKIGRKANSGLIEAYIHHDGRLGVLLELNCETDFVARTDEFKALAREICIQIAAESPLYICREEVPAEVVVKEKAIYCEQVSVEGKPENVAEKIVESKLENFYKTNCLTESLYVRDPSKTIENLVTEMIAKVGENVRIRRFARFRLGEEL
jgi:elongation factor Ts